jgi:hypothetical protein
VKWLRRSADQGCAFGQTTLGLSYATGEGVTKDNVMAYMWSDIAARTGIMRSGSCRVRAFVAPPSPGAISILPHPLTTPNLTAQEYITQHHEPQIYRWYHDSCRAGSSAFHRGRSRTHG